MTDEATPVAAEESVAPIDAPTPDEPAVEPAAEPKGLRENIESAIETVDAAEPVEAEPAAEPVAEETDDRPRNPDGTFKAKEPETAEKVAEEGQEPAKEPSKFDEPPSRFSAEAKTAWAELPETVKAETHRAFTEMEAGIQKYQQAFEPFREFSENLEANGQDFQAVLSHYTGIENLLQENPVAGLEQICSNLGLTLQQVAEHVTGQTPDQNASRQEQIINNLNQKIAGLEQKLTGVDTTIKSQAEAQVLKEIEAFAQDKPRFEELAPDIALFVQNGRATTLQEAYEMAERLNPAPVPADPPPPPPETAQTRKGQLSTTGAPSSGSNPANRKPPSSAREAIERQMAAAGL